jgi:hypothetical protein
MSWSMRPRRERGKFERGKRKNTRPQQSGGSEERFWVRLGSSTNIQGCANDRTFNARFNRGRGETSMNEPDEAKLYDIFSGNLNDGPLWIVAVSGLRASIDVMKRMADEHPGSYFVFDTLGRSVVAQIGPLNPGLNLVA